MDIILNPLSKDLLAMYDPSMLPAMIRMFDTLGRITKLVEYDIDYGIVGELSRGA